MQEVIQLFTLLACLIILIIYLPSILHPIRNAPPIPSSNKSRKEVIAALHGLGPISNLVEVGSGWGGLTKKIVAIPSIKSITAIELSPVLAAICYLRLRKKAKVVCADAFSKRGLKTIKEADVIVLYAFKEFNDAIFPAIKNNAIIISVAFQFKDMQTIAPVSNNVYIYKKNVIIPHDP